MNTTTNSKEPHEIASSVAHDQDESSCACCPGCTCGSTCKCQPGSACAPGCRCAG